MNKRNTNNDRKSTGKRGPSKKDSFRSNPDRRDSDRGPRSRDKDGDSYRPSKKDSEDSSYSGPKRSSKKDGDAGYDGRKKSFGGPKRFEKGKAKRDGDRTYGDRKKSVSGPRGFDKGENKRDGESRFGDKKRSFSGPKPFTRDNDKRDGDSRYGDKKRAFSGPKRSEEREDKRDGESRFDDKKRTFSGPKRSGRNDDKRDGEDRKSYSGPKKDFDKRDDRGSGRDDKRRSESRDRKEPESKKRPRTSKFNEKDQELIGNWRNDRPADSEIRDERKRREVQTITEETRLNKFLANSGLCSRRDADDYIQNGAVSINGQVIKELGVKVMPGDEVRFKGRLILPEKPVYILMNKPKDCITSSDDPDGRRTVLDIIGDHVEERIFPVGRLDRNTTGVLLLTNDGDLAQKLTHPSFGVHKIYKADLDKPMSGEDMTKLRAGLDLEDGFIQPDEVAYVDDSKQVIGIEIHSGKNHIVHRIFNALGYMVDKLDRVSFAGLSKDGLKRGDIRHLTEKELLTLRKSTGKQKA